MLGRVGNNERGYQIHNNPIVLTTSIKTLAELSWCGLLKFYVENSGRSRPCTCRSPYYRGEPFTEDEAVDYKPIVFEMNEDGIVKAIIIHAGIGTVKVTDKTGKDEDEPLTPTSAHFPPDLPAYPRSPTISAYKISYMEPGAETAQNIEQYGWYVPVWSTRNIGF